MRYNTPVYFQHVTPGELNPETGNHEPDEIAEVMKRADVTDSATETLHLVYGEIRQGCKTIRLRTSYKAPFSRIRLVEDGTDHFYHVDKSMLKKRVFVAHEVQGNG